MMTTLFTEFADLDVAPDQTITVDDLKELMRAVSDTAERLEVTHTTLQGQVARLQRELAEANAQLRRSKALAALGEMAAGIAHEIRNPLGSIRLYAQLLEDDLRDDARHNELCRKIGQAVTGLDAIVRDVLLFARETKVRPERTSADELFDRAIASNESLLREYGVRVERRIVADANLLCDEVLISQALTNLIRNAIEAMCDAKTAAPVLRLEAAWSKVQVSGERRERRLVLSVQDNGPGVPAEIVDRMFNPFFTTRASGTGLGLAIVHRILDAHGGDVIVRGMEPAPGARVELRLCEAPPRAKVAEVSAQQLHQTVRQTTSNATAPSPSSSPAFTPASSSKPFISTSFTRQ